MLDAEPHVATSVAEDGSDDHGFRGPWWGHDGSGGGTEFWCDAVGSGGWGILVVGWIAVGGGFNVVA